MVGPQVGFLQERMHPRPGAEALNFCSFLGGSLLENFPSCDTRWRGHATLGMLSPHSQESISVPKAFGED